MEQGIIMILALFFITILCKKGCFEVLCLPRKKSYRAAVCKATLRRGILNKEEEALVREQLWRFERGDDGEERADSFWAELVIPGDYMLFHNFETVGKGEFTHQMDTVFVCPRFVLVLELKHIAGEMIYDAKRHQLIRTYQGQVHSLGDPFSQVSRHEGWMERFLWEIGVRSLPVVAAVVVTTTSSILKQMPEHFHVFKLEGLRFKLKQFYDAYPVAVNSQVLQHIREELLKRHQPKKWMPPIEGLKLRRGVLCTCGMRMTYRYGVFTCHCGQRSRDGFLRGLEDYRLLKDEWITNKAFREFFDIDDKHLVSKILKRMNLKAEGVGKSRKYFIPEDILERK